MSGHGAPTTEPVDCSDLRVAVVAASWHTEVMDGLLAGTQRALDAHGVAYAFHDYKTAGLDEARLQGWIDELGWEPLLNRAGTTFRKLPEGEKSDLDAEKAKRLMLAQPSMIKRPVLDVGGRLIVGFKPEAYEGTVEG